MSDRTANSIEAPPHRTDLLPDVLASGTGSDDPSQTPGRRLRSFHQGKGKKVPFQPKLTDGKSEPMAGDTPKREPPRSMERSEDPVHPEAAKMAVPDVNAAGREENPRRGFLTLFIVIGVGVVGWCVLCGVGIGYWLGRSSQRDGKVIAALSAETEGQVSSALEKLRAGAADEALQELQAARSTSPQTPSLAYLAGLAALQAGNMPLAEKLTKESIALGERVSDALALRAVMKTLSASDSSQVKLGDPGLRAEQILQGAIAADPANPFPYVELATLLRSRGRTQDAVAALRSAKSRLQPFDSHVVAAVTLALMELEAMSGDALPGVTPASGDASSLFPAAYAALRRGEFSEAAALLKQCRTLLSPDLFDYLMSDPAMRKFSGQVEVREFFAP